MVMQRILVAQLVIALAVAVGFLMLQGVLEARAALYGGGVTLVNSLWLARRIRWAEDLAQRSAARGAASLYLGALERFLLVLALLVLGLGLLKLAPVPLVVGFGVAHLGFPMGWSRSLETSRTS
jgi:ATP synthase protein I